MAAFNIPSTRSATKPDPGDSAVRCTAAGRPGDVKANCFNRSPWLNPIMTSLRRSP
jgi:hypothetical protein